MSADLRGINSGERVDSYLERHLWVIAGAVLTGLFLRMRGAAGDLWLDEIWTLRLIGPATSVSDIFLRTPHDNNHYLNSAWLFAVGPEASTLAMRAASVVLGCLSVIAAAFATAKQAKTASVLAAALFATSYFFVHYGSEARGYSGMILCILSARAALDSLMEDRPPLLAWWIFFAAVCLGVFFHLTMVEAGSALACAALAQTLDEARLRRGVLIAAGAALACFPALGCFIYGAFSPQFGVGAMGPFTYDAMFRGLSGAARAVLGLPADMGDWLCILSTALAAAGALTLLPRSRRWFPIAAIFFLTRPACGRPIAEPILPAVSFDRGGWPASPRKRGSRGAAHAWRDKPGARHRRARLLRNFANRGAFEFLSRLARGLFRRCSIHDGEWTGELHCGPMEGRNRRRRELYRQTARCAASLRQIRGSLYEPV